ncbi:hypothetical protein DIPPA_22109 [Diplonema papillatum]|nr:hypothetical protein DIPPA_22109 [Diplonema papillatum]
MGLSLRPLHSNSTRTNHTKKRSECGGRQCGGPPLPALGTRRKEGAVRPELIAGAVATADPMIPLRGVWVAGGGVAEGRQRRASSRARAPGAEGAGESWGTGWAVERMLPQAVKQQRPPPATGRGLPPVVTRLAKPARLENEPVLNAYDKVAETAKTARLKLRSHPEEAGRLVEGSILPQLRELSRRPVRPETGSSATIKRGVNVAAKLLRNLGELIRDKAVPSTSEALAGVLPAVSRLVHPYVQNDHMGRVVPAYLLLLHRSHAYPSPDVWSKLQVLLQSHTFAEKASAQAPVEVAMLYSRILHDPQCTQPLTPDDTITLVDFLHRRYVVHNHSGELTSKQVAVLAVMLRLVSRHLVEEDDEKRMKALQETCCCLMSRLCDVLALLPGCSASDSDAKDWERGSASVLIINVVQAAWAFLELPAECVSRAVQADVGRLLVQTSAVALLRRRLLSGAVAGECWIRLAWCLTRAQTSAHALHVSLLLREAIARSPNLQDTGQFAITPGGLNPRFARNDLLLFIVAAGRVRDASMIAAALRAFVVRMRHAEDDAAPSAFQLSVVFWSLGKALPYFDDLTQPSSFVSCGFDFQSSYALLDAVPVFLSLLLEEISSNPHQFTPLSAVHALQGVLAVFERLPMLPFPGSLDGVVASIVGRLLALHAPDPVYGVSAPAVDGAFRALFAACLDQSTVFSAHLPELAASLCLSASVAFDEAFLAFLFAHSLDVPPAVLHELLHSVCSSLRSAHATLPLSFVVFAFDDACATAPYSPSLTHALLDSLPDAVEGAVSLAQAETIFRASAASPFLLTLLLEDDLGRVLTSTRGTTGFPAQGACCDIPGTVFFELLGDGDIACAY